MNTKWFIGLVLLFVALTIISGIIEGTYVSASQTSRLQQLMQPQMPAYSNPIGAVVAFFNVTWDYLQNLWGIFWFDYAFFAGGWMIMRFFFMSVSIGIIITLIIAVVRGVGAS